MVDNLLNWRKNTSLIGIRQLIILFWNLSSWLTMNRKLIRKSSSIMNVLYFCQTCIIWVDSLHINRIDKCDLENNHLILVHAYFSFQKWRRKFVSILVAANRPGHKIREIGGYRYKSCFFSKTRWSTYILTFIFLTAWDGSLQRYMICLLDLLWKVQWRNML